LIATKWGLGSAIPLLLAYNLIDSWSVRIIANMEKHSARLINTVFANRQVVDQRVREQQVA